MATREAGEPNHAGEPGGKSIWWKWTAPSELSVTVDTHGSSFDTLLAVYTGNSVERLQVVAGNDDWGGPTSQVSFMATAGVEYQIAVDGFDGMGGEVVLNVLAGLGNHAPVVDLVVAPERFFVAGQVVTLTATALDPDGQVVKVEFFNGTAKLGEDTTAPYAWALSTLPVGPHLLIATATDDQGAKSSAAVELEGRAELEPHLFTTLAGPSGRGSLDGEGIAARFESPKGVAVDSAGCVYVADTLNHTIRKITPAGEVATLAGKARESGGADGPASVARFNQPEDVAVDNVGNVYVADSGNHTIRKITAEGVVTTLAGSARKWGSPDGKGSVARFGYPKGVAVDGAGNIYVADSGNHTIRKITARGVVTTLAGSPKESGNADGAGSSARFHHPTGLAVDGAGTVYVADVFNHSILTHTIRKITPAGEVTTLAGSATESGSADGTGSAARFDSPEDVAVDNAGNVYVADTQNQAIRKITPGGAVTTWAGSPGNPGNADGLGGAARFNSPEGVAVDGAGNVYVADTLNHTIRKVTPGGEVATWAGSAGNAGGAALPFAPAGMALDGAGNVYVADSGNHTIRKVTPGGVAATWAGSAGESGHADGAGSAARFDRPEGVAVDGAGHVYVADSGNQTIRRVTPGGVVATLAGSPGKHGSSDGLGTEARFNNPRGVVVDGAGNVYVSDSLNHSIRKITPRGEVTTLAGRAREPGSADGPRSVARFGHPTGVAVDSGGNVYVADTYNHTIRKITPAGEVATLAGLGTSWGSADGAGRKARFFYPQGVAVDSMGNVYVADNSNHSIRKITPGGEVTTLVRWVGNVGAAQGGFPTGVAVDRAGNIYVSETSNHSILVGRRTTVVDPAPSLAARREGGQIILSWPQIAVGYALEQSGQLGAGAAWSPITTGIGTEGANFTHTHGPTEGSRFFRLRKP